MAKQLKDILKQAHDRIKGVHSSQTSDASLGKDPGVDYKPKSGDEQDFVAKHSVEKWDEPYGNPNYSDSVKFSLEKEKKHGYTKPEDKKVNESKKAEDVKCNNTAAKTWCPMHEMADCTAAKNITEDDLDEVVVARRMTSQEKAARAAYLKKHSEKVAGHDNGIAPKKSFKDVNTERGDYTSQPSKMGIRHAMASGYYKNEEVERVNEVSKRTIASYVDKAEKSSRDLEGKNDNKSWRKMHKRDDSVLMAKDKWAGKRKVAATEEVEQVDEISKDLTRRYIKKASDQVDNTYEYHGDKKTTKKLDNREVGIRTASMKKNASKYIKVPATEEVEQIDELSPATLNSYKSKAAGSERALTDKSSLLSVPAKNRNAAAIKANQRRQGMNLATKKLGEEAIDEVLTKSTTAGETISDFVHSDNPKFAGKSKEKRKQMALAAYYAKQNEEAVQECGNAVEPLLGGNQPPRGGSDEAAEMVKSELKALSNKAMHLVTQMPDNMHVEPWVQAKIATAKELVSSVHDYMVYGDHDKEQEKETMDTPMTFPNMSVDVNTGQNV
jgi:hypothetical protein